MENKSLVVVPQWKEREAFLLNKIRIYREYNNSKEDPINYIIASVQNDKVYNIDKPKFFEIIKKDDLKGLNINIQSFRKYLLPYIIFYQKYEDFYTYSKEVDYKKDRFIKEHYIDLKIPIKINVVNKKGKTKVKDTNKEVIIRLKGNLISEALKSYVQQQDIFKLYGKEKSYYRFYYANISKRVDGILTPIRYAKDFNNGEFQERYYLSRKYGFLNTSPSYRVTEYSDALENFYWTEDRKHIIKVSKHFNKKTKKRELSLYPIKRKKILINGDSTQKSFLTRRKEFVELLENMFSNVSNNEEQISFDEYLNQWSKRLLREVSFKESLKGAEDGRNSFKNVLIL